MDKIIEGTKFFDELLAEKGKMTRDDFATSYTEYAAQEEPYTIPKVF